MDKKKNGERILNSIDFGLSGDVPSLIVKIDGIDVLSMDEFKGDFIPTEAPTFLFNEYMWANSKEDNVFNGTMLIGMCSCGCHGCDDIVVKISTNSRTTKWVIMLDRNHKKKRAFFFSTEEYTYQINKLKDDYYSYSWETKEDKIRRICSEYIRTFKTKEGYNIEGLKIPAIWDDACENITGKICDTIEIYYYSDWEPMGKGYGRPYHNWKIKFDGKTLESAMKSLERFATKSLIKSDGEVSLRPTPFRLLYTKDKTVIEELLAQQEKKKQ